MPVKEDHSKISVGSGKKWLMIAALILVPLWLYYPVTGYDYVRFDDNLIIQNNFDKLKEIKNLSYAFNTDAFLKSPGELFYRPVQTLSFMFDAWISNDTTLFVFHLINILLHILSTVFLFVLLNQFFQNRMMNFLLSLVFAVHPLFVSNVAWIPARGDLLLGLWGILLFLTFMWYKKNRSMLVFLAHTLFCLLAIFTKETAILFPILFICYHGFTKNLKSKFSELNYCIGTWIISTVIYFIARSIVLHPTSGNNPINPVSSFFNNLFAIPVFASKLIFPFSLTTLPLFDIMSIVLGGVLIILMFIYLYRFKSERLSLLLFGGIWFLAFTLPPLLSSVNYPAYFFQYLEHRAYLPAIGLIISIAYLLDKYVQRKYVMQTGVIFVVVIISFVFIAKQHLSDYQDSISFYTAAIDTNPEKNAYAYTNRGSVYAKMGELTAAINDQQSAINILQNFELYYNKGGNEIDAGLNDEAIADLTKSIQLKNDFAPAYINRSTAYEKTGKLDSAMSDIRKALLLDPKNDIALCRIANVYFKSNKLVEAFENYTKSLSINPNNAEALNKRSRIYFIQKKYTEALNDCDRLIRINKYLDIAYNNTGLIYYEMNQYEMASSSFTRSIHYSDKFGDTYFNRARCFLKMNKIGQACNDLKQAVALGFTPATDTLNKYCN